ncbi:hypothetical protein CFSAN001627_21124 [Clostridium botulinum CFSAN001627]|uniref:Uncharacterized protein n=1 Tax=Clostridium botulinum CFSAN001627 TaxID=1232189 RepID=M1ZTG6_CLOBO|nr:hypothetical protein [Clostridium botulinum]EDT83026.1 hypothetical protein CBN_1417 [Clostridium botulinum NCTC 2916]EKN40214.1 hypothetical protein CFSAN001627_21124 [Clostridium botulinum CFSAN001627]
MFLEVFVKRWEKILSKTRVMIENHREDIRDNLDFLNTIFLSFMK